MTIFPDEASTGRRKTRQRANGEPQEPREKRRRRQPGDKEFDRRAAAAAWQTPPASAWETSFRHSHWQERRAKIRQVMQRTAASSFALDRWDNCGSDAFVEWSESEKKHRVRANYCHSRHCEPCMRAKANKMAANLKARLRERPQGKYRFVTLSLKHTDAPLVDQIRRLYLGFRKLRQAKLWKRSQRGGVFILEVKRGAAGWHPHLHVIAEGDWLPQRALSEAWLKVTGDSFIVDVRLLKTGDDAAHYVCKYITKGTSVDVWSNPELGAEWISATRGVRTAATFGTWRGFKLLQLAQSADDWAPVDRLDTLIARARAGEEHAALLIASLRPPGEFDAHLVQ